MKLVPGKLYMTTNHIMIHGETWEETVPPDTILLFIEYEYKNFGELNYYNLIFLWGKEIIKTERFYEDFYLEEIYKYE